MAPSQDDDLFQHTSMTFGEHLEELRSALFKAVIALVIGFVIGLLFAAPIVRAIERPLKAALFDFYQEQAVEYLRVHLPAELFADEATNKALVDLVYTHGLMPEERYISPGDVLGALREHYPGKFTDLDLSESTPGAAAPDGAPPETQPNETPANDTPPADEATADAKPAAASPAEKPAVAKRTFSKESMIRLFIWRRLADDERLKLDALGVQEPFVIYIKAGFLAGAIISSPAVFYFLWQFVAAGLYPHEKKYVHLFLPFSLGLFFAGAALAFFFVFPPVLKFFFGIAESLGTEMRPRLSEWLSFVLLLPLGFGVSFQLPLVMLFLERINVFSVSIYLAKWRIAVLIMAVVSMVLSPGGDPYSMLMMLIPLVLLYFAGVALCHFLPNPRKQIGPPGTRS
jgi:sec-independent protein translocase protein TatC